MLCSSNNLRVDALPPEALDSVFMSVNVNNCEVTSNAGNALVGEKVAKRFEMQCRSSSLELERFAKDNGDGLPFHAHVSSCADTKESQCFPMMFATLSADNPSAI